MPHRSNSRCWRLGSPRSSKAYLDPASAPFVTGQVPCLADTAWPSKVCIRPFYHWMTPSGRPGNPERVYPRLCSGRRVVPRPLPEHKALQLGVFGARQGIDKADAAWVFVGRQPLLDPVLQFA